MIYSRPWLVRIENANKYYKEWEARYKCKILEEYWRGKQWKFKNEVLSPNYNPYTLNLVYSTIKIKLASIIFQHPKYLISPAPGNSNWDQEFAIKSAQLKEDILNTIINTPCYNFTKNVKLAAMDSFFRFGILEIGYAADWRNPQKQQPLTKVYEDPTVSLEKDRVLDENEVPINESFYFKRIKARRFRVSASDSEFVEKCAWVGYYDWIYKNTLRNTKGIKFPTTYDRQIYSTDVYNTEQREFDSIDSFRTFNDHEACKVWHIFDNVSKTRYLILDNYDCEPLWEGSFERLPFAEIRWDFNLEGWYPIPPVYQWLSPQDEINEAREQMRSYRKRFTRKYQAVEGGVDEEEIEKFTSGPDGVIIKVKRENAIQPISNTDTGPSIESALIIAKDDFNIISGTSSEQRGQSDRTTATQAKLIDVRSQIRESAEQVDFTDFMTAIARECLLQAQEKLATGLWIKYSQDPGEDFLGEIKVNEPIYKYVTSQQIDDGYDFEIKIDVASGSPAQQQEDLQKFIQFLSVINQFPQISLSPILIREAAYKCGYRNERVIQQMQQAALLQMMGQAALAKGAGGAGGANANNTAKAAVAQASPNTTEAIQQQLQNQLPVQ